MRKQLEFRRCVRLQGAWHGFLKSIPLNWDFAEMTET